MSIISSIAFSNKERAMTKTFFVPAISCQHCVMTIKRELSAISGVGKVEGDPQTKQVTVTLSSEDLLPKVKELMTEIGYPIAKEV